MADGRPVLVVGATGGFGAAVVEALLAEGRAVRAMTRRPRAALGRFGRHDGLEIVSGDALDPGALQRAVTSCRAIVVGVRLPEAEADPLMYRVVDHVLAAAGTAGAAVLFPADVAVLGEGASEPAPEEAAVRPCTPAGNLRVRVEATLAAAARTGGPPVLVLRAGDQFGPTVRNPLVDPIFGNAARGRPIRALGRLDVAHQWAYAPDLARVACALLETPAGEMAPFETVHFRGYVAAPARRFFETVARAAGRPDLPVRRLPWWRLRAAGLADRTARELLGLRPRFDRPVLLDDPRCRARFPDFQPTPLDEAVEATVESYRVAA